MEIIGDGSKNPERKPVGLEAKCWGCGKVWNISLLPADSKGVRCTDCNNFVVSESGKAMSRPFYDAYDSYSPLLEVTKPKIILD